MGKYVDPRNLESLQAYNIIPLPDEKEDVPTDEEENLDLFEEEQ